VIKNIKNTNPVTYSYILKDYQSETIQECFYEYELLKTKANIYLIQKILKQKGNKVYVKWLGFSDKHNTWIDKSKIL
jgi:hypothetical protein